MDIKPFSSMDGSMGDVSTIWMLWNFRLLGLFLSFTSTADSSILLNRSVIRFLISYISVTSVEYIVNKIFSQHINQFSSMKSSGLQRVFNSKIAKALGVPINIKKVQYSFSPGKIRLQADASLHAAFGGSL